MFCELVDFFPRKAESLDFRGGDGSAVQVWWVCLDEANIAKGKRAKRLFSVVESRAFCISLSRVVRFVQNVMVR